MIIGWILIVCALLVAEEKFIKPPVVRGDINSINNYVTNELNEAYEQKRLGSASFTLVEKGKIVNEHTVGKGLNNATVQADKTLFLLSSVSKAVTAWGVMKLVQEGELKLDDPVMLHLKRWRFAGSERYRDRVTVRHLLSHTSGLVDGYGQGGTSLDEKLQPVEESLNSPTDVNMGEAHAAIIVNEPGKVVAYSSNGYAVLQLLIEDITGKRFNDYMREEVIQPLGMLKSSYDVDAIITEGRLQDLATNYDLELQPYPIRHYSNMAGVSLRSTSHDLAQLVMAYYNENSVLSKQTIQLMLMPQANTNKQWALGHTLYTQQANETYIVGHGGGAFPASGAEMRLSPATGNGIVILAAGTQGLISDLADVWTYWETGHKLFDIRNVIRKRSVHASILVIVGVVVILIWQNKRTKRKGIMQTI